MNMKKQLMCLTMALTMLTGVGETVIPFNVYATNEESLTVGVNENYTSVTSIDLTTGDIEESLVEIVEKPEILLEADVINSEITNENTPSTYNYDSDWSKVSNVNATPYDGIVKITSYYSDGTSKTGTGFIVDDGKILTAAHCIYDVDKRIWVTSLKVEFGKNGYSSATSVTTQSATIPSAWMNVNYDGDANSYITYDYGVINVNSAYTNGRTKFNMSSSVPYGSYANISGYPNTSPFTGNLMYTDYEYISGTFGTGIRHYIDIMNGVSGAPLYDTRLNVYGIQTKGYSVLANNSNPSNIVTGKGGIATAITSNVINFVNSVY